MSLERRDGKGNRGGEDMMITKTVSIHYTPRSYTFTFRGWLFWYWRVCTEKIYPPMKGCFSGVRLFGFSIQSVWRKER